MSVLDTLKFSLPRPYSTVPFYQEHALENEIQCVPMKLGNSQKPEDNRSVLRLGPEGTKFYLEKENWRSSYITAIIIHPSSFSDYSELENFYQRALPTQVAASARLTRLDAAIDIRIPFSEIFSGFDVGLKRRIGLWLQLGKRRTSVTFGNPKTSPEYMVVYDKALQSRSSQPLTRIEVRHHGEKLLFQRFRELPRLLRANFLGLYAPFKGISYRPTTLIAEFPPT